MLRLIVNFEDMQREIARMNEISDDYRYLYGSLLNRVDESSLHWKGKDQEAFISRIHAFEGDFDKLHRLLKQYIEFLEKSMQSYRMCQDQAEASSLRL